MLVNFLAAAAIMTRAAKSGPTAIGAAALGGYVLRLAVILVALVVLRHQPWIDLPTLGFVIVGTHLGSARLGNEVRESHARCAGVEAGTTFRRPMNALLLAVDVPPISHVTIWGSGPLGFNKTAAIYIFATLATILLFVLGTRQQGRARAVRAAAEHRGVGRRLRAQPDHHADDGNRRPAATCRT